MPLAGFSPDVLLIAAAAQRVAYGEGRSSTRTFMDALGQSGWNPLTGLGVDARGFYIDDNAAAFAMVRGGTIIIGIRGSADPNDAVPSEDGLGWDIGSDWLSAAANPISYYENVQSFIRAVLDYAGSNYRIVVAGHSLGGQSALVATALDIQARINANQFQAEDVSIITFGAPGVPFAIDAGISSALESRILSFVNSDDWVPLDSIATFTQYYPGTRFTFHVLDDSGIGEGFDSSDDDVGNVVHSQSLYYQVVTDLGYAEWYTTWSASGSGLYALHSDFFYDPHDDFLLTQSQVSAAVLGLSGNDLIRRPATQAGTVFISGGVGNDTITGSDAVDYIDGGSDLDTLQGLGGNDHLWGGPGVDLINAGAGADFIYGGAGSDTAIFDHTLSAYALSREAGTGVYLVRHIATGDVDRLSSIEYLQFGPNAAPQAIGSFNWSGATSPPPPPPTVPPPSTPPPPPPPGDDYGNSAATAHAIAPGVLLAGRIETIGDQDWFAITLQAGVLYSFAMAGGSYGGVSQLPSPHLYLRDGAGEIVAHGSPVSTNSIFQFTPNASGVYYLQARAHGDLSTGTYGLSVVQIGSSPPPPPPPPGPVRLDLDAVEDIAEEDGPQLIYHVEYRGELTEDIVIGWTLVPTGDHPIDALDVAAMSGQVILRATDDDGHVTIRVTPQTDRVDEEDETFEIRIHVISGSATITDDDAWGTILNDDEGNILPHVDEHSNSFSGATIITEDTWTRGFITTPGDLDFFQVTLTGGATYELVIVGDDDTSLIDGDEDGFVSLSDPQAALYDANFNLIANVFFEENGARIEHLITPAITGVYYIAVREDGNNDVGQYFINPQVRIPADDFAGDVSTAATLAEGQFGLINNERPGDDDWIRVSLNAGQTYSFFAVLDQHLDSMTYTWPAWVGEVQVRLYNESGQQVASFAPGPISTQSNQLTFTPSTSGVYYFSVSSPSPFNYTNMEYRVGFEAITPQPTGQPIIVQPGPTAGVDLSFGHIRLDGPGNVAGVDSSALSVGGHFASGSAGSALRFDLQNLPREASAAYVQIYLSDAMWNGTGGYAPSTMILAAAGASWSETSSFPDLGRYWFNAWLAAPTGPGWYTIDITALYNQWQSGALANNGLMLLPVDLATVTNLFFSSDHADPALRPRLVIYERPPGQIVGTSAFETLNGTHQADAIQALSGDDLINALAGDDIIDGGVGADVIDGGDGYDTAAYTSSPEGVSVNLLANQTSGGHATGDSLLNIENLSGSAHADTLIGNSAANRLTGAAGADSIDGGSGVDVSVYTIASTSATWVRNLNGSWTVTAGADGTDTVANVEFLDFTDRDVFLDRAAQTFSGDGASDIVWRNAQGVSVIWSLTGATVAQTANTSLQAGNEWAIQGFGDFNGDGRDDFVWRNTNGVSVIWTMNGAAVGQSLNTSLQAGNEWAIQAFGDFNGDGRDDFLWRNQNGVSHLWLMDAAAAAGANTSLQAGNEWTVQAAADFNGDGRDDILFRTAGGTTVIWQMNGATVSQSALTSLQAGTEWAVAGTGDFDGDGRDDILWRNTTGVTVIWRMDGANLLQAAPTSIQAGTEWAIQSIGDYNGDGKDDILWRHTSGATVVWNMNAATVLSAALTSITAGNEWTII
jgi:hypothetical protein